MRTLAKRFGAARRDGPGGRRSSPLDKSNHIGYATARPVDLNAGRRGSGRTPVDGASSLSATERPLVAPSRRGRCGWPARNGFGCILPRSRKLAPFRRKPGYGCSRVRGAPPPSPPGETGPGKAAGPPARWRGGSATGCGRTFGESRPSAPAVPGKQGSNRARAHGGGGQAERARRTSRRLHPSVVREPPA